MEIENDGNVLELRQGKLLLQALEEAGYNLLTHCGGVGDCASCRVNLTESHQSIEDSNYGPLLTPRQQNEGWVISCRTLVMGDMKVKLYQTTCVELAEFQSPLNVRRSSRAS